MTGHYLKKYFTWQIKGGKYAAQQDVWMYAKYIKKSDKVLDFGCGGGFLLEQIKCSRKYGIDINPYARKEAKKRGLIVYPEVGLFPNNLKVDIVMSHHTLEHVSNPNVILIQLKNILRRGGKIVCVVPIDDWRKGKKYDKKDINKHLYTWSPLLLANLFEFSGFKMDKVEIINRSWLPLSRFYYPYVPKFIYTFFSRMWSILILSRQIRIVATK